MADRIATSPVLIPRWQVGERVKRRRDVYDQKSPFRHGDVVLRYSATYPSRPDLPAHDYPELYAVQWDDGKFERGFLRHGLDFGEPLPRDEYVQ